jgi:hypothetical protein
VVDDHGVRDDHRLGGRQLDPLIHAGQPLVRDPRGRHCQRLVPAGAHRLGHHHPGQQHRGVDRLSPDRPQDRGAERPGPDVDRGDQLGPAGHPVVHDGHDVQRGAVHEHLLARPGGADRGERPVWPVGRLPAGHRRAERVLAGRQHVQEPVERRVRRHRHRPRAVLVLHQLPDPPHRPGLGASRGAHLPVDHRGGRGHHPGVDVPRRPGPLRVAGIDQAPQSLVPVAAQHPLDRPQGHAQLTGLGLRPLGQRAGRRVELRLRGRARLRARGKPGLHLGQVPLPLARRRGNLLRQGVQQPGRHHARTRPGSDHGEVRRSRQVGHRHHNGLPGVSHQPHQAARQRDNGVLGAGEHDPVADPHDPRALSHGPPSRPRSGG